jgi:hypothetical protein
MGSLHLHFLPIELYSDWLSQKRPTRSYRSAIILAKIMRVPKEDLNKALAEEKAANSDHC